MRCSGGSSFIQLRNISRKRFLMQFIKKNCIVRMIQEQKVRRQKQVSYIKSNIKRNIFKNMYAIYIFNKYKLTLVSLMRPLPPRGRSGRFLRTVSPLSPKCLQKASHQVTETLKINNNLIVGISLESTFLLFFLS